MKFSIELYELRRIFDTFKLEYTKQIESIARIKFEAVDSVINQKVDYVQITAIGSKGYHRYVRVCDVGRRLNEIKVEEGGIVEVDFDLLNNIIISYIKDTTIYFHSIENNEIPYLVVTADKVKFILMSCSKRECEEI